MPWYSGKSKHDREVVRCYYEFNTRKDIGPTGDFVEAGLYWTNEPFSAMEVQSDRAWYKLANGTIEQGRPCHGIPTAAEVMWIELKAKYLNWAMVN